MMYWFESLEEKHRRPVIDLYNYYVDHGYSIFHDYNVGYDFFDQFVGKAEGYPKIAVRSYWGRLAGFSFLKPFLMPNSTAKAAEITSFISPEFTGKGIGTEILNYMFDKARDMGISSIIASASSLNQGSINQLKKYGFQENGSMRRAGIKNGKVFDVIFMRKDT
ncbi:MAG: N-acetyltransferase family protein [Candidatus Saccharibacteria bacterium]